MNAVSLHKLAHGKTPVDAKLLAQIQRWLDADWESHDIDRDVVHLIRRLVTTLEGMLNEKRKAAR